MNEGARILYKCRCVTGFWRRRLRLNDTRFPTYWICKAPWCERGLNGERFPAHRKLSIQQFTLFLLFRFACVMKHFKNQYIWNNLIFVIFISGNKYFSFFFNFFIYYNVYSILSTNVFFFFLNNISVYLYNFLLFHQ